jgi:hypothetical protein
VSRTRRSIDPAPEAEVWAAVDSWAERAVDPVPMRARWSARAVPVRGVGNLVDVTGDAGTARAALRSAGLRVRPIRPARRALGRTGEIAYPDDEQLIEVLDEAGVDHRVVTRARRYLWRASFTGPTFCEISTEAGDGPTTVEAWYEPVWTDSLRFRGDGRTEEPRRPRRALQARASINRLLGDLGTDLITTA